ncbi:YkgB family protein [Vibrio alginolyticus]|uniref:YkgB family protein n=1 Tax=Vibrio alginolyticus TaxID=663 RepID=UPI00215B8113|nr:YkgB family protein [Vibrio alginolyticus]MCR9444334.1 YkgB family protein [Vibrio alginolyticus]MCR9448080.1 YkgB family protein [Vibrio alginolyticus]MCR9457472.1 YkgB family protein [Vibrio alginolyticus]
MQNVKNHHQCDSIGYLIGVFGVSLVLIWIGIYKFTPTEAKLIQPLVENHFLMSWLYDVMSVQAVSNIIGATEIIVAIGLIVGLKNTRVAYFSGIAAAIIFLATLSFLITTPNTWKVSDGVLVTNFFLVKDILFLAIAISVIERNKPNRE